MRRKVILIGLMLLAMLVLPVSSKFMRLNSATLDEHSVLNLSGYKAHDPIVIQSNDDFETQGWPGAGSKENPYVISNLSIVSAVTCINVTGVNVSFVIRNCEITNTDSGWAATGIFVSSSGVVRNNTIYAPFGIWIMAPDSTIEGNRLFGCNRAIRLENADRINITDNEVSGGLDGIELWGSSNSSMSRNVFSNVDAGIRTGPTSDNCTIENNAITVKIGGAHTIQLDSSFNLVANNTLRKLGAQHELNAVLNFGHYNEYRNNTVLGDVRIEGKNCRIVDNNITGGYIWFTGEGYEYWNHTMSGNMVNGGPVLFLKGQEDAVLNVVDYTQVVLLDNLNVIIRDSILSTPIMVGYSQNVTISGNTISDTYWGMVFVAVRNFTVSNNTIIGLGAEYGAGMVFKNSNEAIIENNTIADISRGMEISISHHFIIRFNKITACFLGLELGGTAYIDIINNTIVASDDRGIYVWGSLSLPPSTYMIASTESSINILWNDFIGNGISGVDDSISAPNYAYNHWSDYEGEDVDGDGFGETPYYVEGTSGAEDNYPRLFLLSGELPVTTTTTDSTTTDVTTSITTSDELPTPFPTELILGIGGVGVVIIIAAYVLKKRKA